MSLLSLISVFLLLAVTYLTTSIADSGGRNGMTQSRAWLLIPVILVIVLLGWSVQMRSSVIEGRPLAGLIAGGVDADAENSTAHVLATLVGLRNFEAATHLFLPITTLRPEDKGIDNFPGSTLPDERGIRYYMSWPPLAFSLPLILGEPNVQSIRWFSLTLGLITTMLLGWLTYYMIKLKPYMYRAEHETVPLWNQTTSGPDTKHVQAVFAALAAMLVYACSIEGMRGHSITYWTAQPQQVLLLLQILLILYGRLFLVAPLFFVSALLDWSAYPMGIGAGILLMFVAWNRRKTDEYTNVKSWLTKQDVRAFLGGLGILTATLLGGLTLVIWYGMRLDLGDYFHALLRRSGHNSGANHLQLLPAYSDALGPFGLLANLAFWFCVWAILRKKMQHLHIGVLALLSFPVLENLIMSGHAVYYTYDMLKGISLFAVMIGFAVAYSRKWAPWLFTVVLFLAVLSLLEYKERYGNPSDWAEPSLAAHHRIGTEIRTRAEADTLVLFSHHARGEVMFPARRNMIERVADRARLNNRNDVEEALNTTILMNRPKAMYVRMSSDMRHIDIYDIRNGRADFLERIDMFP